MKEVCVATISWARNEEEEKTLETSLGQLARLGLPVYITDGGSSRRFIQFLNSCSNFTVLRAKGLWQQARTSLTAASKHGATSVLYTEPDKTEFFSSFLLSMLQDSTSEIPGVVLASRTAKGFATFPLFQQTTETAINQSCKEIIGKDIDYCYGPFLCNIQFIPLLKALDDNCGWGWRPFLFAMVHRLGFAVESFEDDFNCPPDQRRDNKSERIYRMKQLTQNINGLIQAATMDLSGKNK